MADSWQPQEDGLRQILQLLKDVQSPDKSTQRAMLQNLDVLMKDPVVNNYLIFVLTKLTSEDEKTRSLSGFFLKKNIQGDFKNFPQAVANHIRSECLSGLGDPTPRIRTNVGIIVKTIVSTGGLDNWPDLLPKLCQMHSTDESSAGCDGGAIGVLLKICEVSMGDLLQGLMLLAAGCDVKVRRNVCRAFVSLVPLMDGIIECVLGLTQDANYAVAMGACRLWLSLVRNQSVCKDVGLLNSQHLARLLPILLKWIRLSDRYVTILLKLMKADDEEDETNHYDSDEDDENSDDSCVMGDDALSDLCINLWLSSITVLHLLSNVFKDELLPALLPSLKEMLFDPEWALKTSGMMALTAIAEGCKTGIVDHLVELVPFLISCLSVENADVIREGACSILGDHADWVVGQPQYLAPLMTELLKLVLDEDKSVQETACSSLSTIQAKAGTHLVPYLCDILETLVRAYGKYHRKNLAILYVTIGTMTRSFGSHLNKPEYINVLMPPLIAKLDVLKDDDDDLVPLLECLFSVAKALQSGFIPYFEPVFGRCIRIVNNTLNQHQAIEQQPDQFQAPDKDCMIGALDLLSGLTEVLGSHAEKLIVPSKMMQLLQQSMQDVTPEVRKSSFALLGSLTKECFDHVPPYLPEFLPILGQNLNPESDPDVWTKAVIAVGEITIKLGNEMHSYIPLFLTQLISIINRPNTPKVCLENTAFTLGRLGYVCTHEVAPYLKEFAQRWFVTMRDVRDQEEMKDSAFRGMCKMLAVNDQGMEKDVLFLFCDAIASWPNARSDLKEKFAKILKSFKRSAGEEGWKEVTDQFPPPLREQMRVQYGT